VGIRGVLFDFGLTLAYPPSFDELVGRAGRALGRDLGDIQAFIDAVNGVVDDPDVLAAERRRDHSVEEHRAADMAYAVAAHADLDLMVGFHQLYLEPDTYALYADVAGILGELWARGQRIGLLSNCGWDLRRNLHHLGIDQSFDAVVLSCQEGMVKPDPALFELACDRLGTVAAETLMVGDSPSTDGRAVEAGLEALVLPLPHGPVRGLEVVLDRLA
jgi:HAD superfamily hydrolase (TIGR01509 family)